LTNVFEVLPLTEPVCAHAVTRPLSLANPTPLEAAARSRANHVHAASCSLSRRATLWTRFGQHFDGDFGGFVPSRISYAVRVDRILACGRAIYSWGFGETFANVISLAAVFAENKLI
jgi:hypothetical protein